MNGSITEDKIYRVLELVSASPHFSQRELAQSAGFSLGLVNLAIKRLIRTGHIKIAQLDKRKVEYNLTPKGMMEKAQRSYLYLSTTMKTFLEYRRRLDQLFHRLSQENHKQFAILGEGEIVSLVEMGLAEAIPDARYRRIADNVLLEPGEVLLDCRLNGVAEFGISVMAHLLK
jgi:DNA-binding MarR family transcriptional regulator